ncbi:MAG: hypothetical protein HW383_438 [Candidatus Magasanikbacteria bacterium]|nr:hypothetical protein [Candidatus Magasanikbacteria bacterium]
MNRFLRKLVPKPLLALYHFSLAKLAATWYGNPSRQLKVIGITGTSGKSTTVFLTAKILEAAGFKVGVTSTMLFKIADKEWLNDRKMTMLGRFQTQKLLRQMVNAGCTHAIIETTSQGIEQFRHIGIKYDLVALTNLYPEHIEAHGSFEKYKAAKIKLFSQAVGAIQVVNADNEHASDFLMTVGDSSKGDTFKSHHNLELSPLELSPLCLHIEGAMTQISESTCTFIKAEEPLADGSGVHFKINDVNFNLQLFGTYNIYNAAMAATICYAFGVPLETSRQGLQKISGVPGRMEFINEGQPFTVIVDYAFEPVALAQTMEIVKQMPHGKIIHVVGSAGGGRDVSRRPKMGMISAQNADITIITNEDPYDDDPQKIIDDVYAGATQSGKMEGEGIFRVLDRREAIQKAIAMASEFGQSDGAAPPPLILITGKGAEQAIADIGGKLIPWDDRAVVRECIGDRKLEDRS